MTDFRIIPTLLLRDSSLVKTRRFSGGDHIGDPCNTARIFNEMRVDELMLIDISRSKGNITPNWSLIGAVAQECFMPTGYGGGIRSFEDAKKVFSLGFEKIILSSLLFDQPDVVARIVETFGSQAVVASIDFKLNIVGRPVVMKQHGRLSTSYRPCDWARQLQDMGVGEILLTSVDREGTWEGVDLDVTRSVARSVNIPVIASGGIGGGDHIVDAVEFGQASAVAVGSLVVFWRQGQGVLVNYDMSEVRER